MKARKIYIREKPWGEETVCRRRNRTKIYSSTSLIISRVPSYWNLFFSYHFFSCLLVIYVLVPPFPPPFFCCFENRTTLAIKQIKKMNLWWWGHWYYQVLNVKRRRRRNRKNIFNHDRINWYDHISFFSNKFVFYNITLSIQFESGGGYCYWASAPQVLDVAHCLSSGANIPMPAWPRDRRPRSPFSSRSCMRWRPA